MYMYVFTRARACAFCMCIVINIILNDHRFKTAVKAYCKFYRDKVKGQDAVPLINNICIFGASRISEKLFPYLR